MKGYEKNEDYLQAIINSLEDELMVIDRDYRIIQANEAVLTRHRKRSDEVTKLTFVRFTYSASFPIAPADTSL